MLHHRFTDWLETHWVTPAYSGWLMGGLAIFFFGAATNTMAGWLYVISGVILALLVVAAILPDRSLRGIQIHRQPIAPISVGESITIRVMLENQTSQVKTLLEVQDRLPAELSSPVKRSIEVISPHETYRWVYQQLGDRRGIYRWHTVFLRTASPLGLFWCRRSQAVKAMAVVYPTVLPLSQCPLVDEMGQDVNTQVLSHSQSHAATEGLTRTLRPYRWGDSIRLVHWRTSARYGELRVRELETYSGGQELVVSLDSAATWESDNFEQAVVAAASLYFYALRHSLRVSLWTARTGAVRGDRLVLETLAETQFGEESLSPRLPELPLLWLTQNPESIHTFPQGSRWLLWLQPASASGRSSANTVPNSNYPGLFIQPDHPLQLQLQSLTEVY
ncbi:MAG: DUF58 domain-containing protein [Cyanobacteria bacterium CRU_2_1]|nr:DUF58 domain-containing protein [Cyanobacteria bacterium RU_5_0]NJR59230.1 DUF58 domain-containing protein [Cyanobacteria bacterium CRU_2_1]